MASGSARRAIYAAIAARVKGKDMQEDHYAMSDAVSVLPGCAKIEQGEDLEACASITHARAKDLPPQGKGSFRTRTMARLPEPEEFLTSSCGDVESSDKPVSVRGSTSAKSKEGSAHASTEAGGQLETCPSVTHARVNNPPRQNRGSTFRRTMVHLPEPEEFLALSCGDVKGPDKPVPVRRTRLPKRKVGIQDVFMEPGERDVSLCPEIEINLAARSKSSATWSHGGSFTFRLDLDGDDYDQPKQPADSSSKFPGAASVARARNLRRLIRTKARSRCQTFCA